jgi:hypothetical protein
MMSNCVNQVHGERFWLLEGDTCELIRELPDNSVGSGGHSPPFSGMYTYTPSSRDIGNCRDMKELIRHYRYIIGELLRITLPGRSHWVHLTQEVTFRKNGEESGLRDFRGAVIREYERAGWIYRGEVAIEKNPQMKAIRTHDNGLLFKTLADDASEMHMCLNDYALQFRKPGQNPVPIRAGNSARYHNPTGWITDQDWINWANGVWRRATEDFPHGIREVNVLNAAAAKEEGDERHVCPLQLDVIHRWVMLGTNPLDFSFREAHADLRGISDDLWRTGATFYTPFLGVGSEVYAAILAGRCGVGSELKHTYWAQAVKNCKRAESEVMTTRSLFAEMEAEELVLT